jgi:hypothetical protein
MATAHLIRTGAVAATLAATALTAHTASPPPPIGGALDGDEIGLIGYTGHVADSTKPRVTAYFTRESYRPDDRAHLIVTDATDYRLQVFRAGGEATPTLANDVMLGTPVTTSQRAHGPRLSVQIGRWPSGVYFARLTAAGARVGYAPFVLRPNRLGEHRVAVVMPTETWQAYNFRDDNGDGQPDTWYAGWKTHQARLIRPFLNRGVPPHWKRYDAPFVRWLTATGRHVDYLSDAELRQVANGEALAKAYSLIIFSGHHEYVTAHEYDVVQRYRDLGGNLAFLAANDFFRKITISHDVMTLVGEWRDLGRPEAALIGAQYRGNDRGQHRGPWILQPDAATTPWLFSGLEAGATIGNGGIEIDATAPSSPKSVRVLAEIPNLYGPGFTAQMTYYETPAGARVFAAGAFSLADEAWDPQISCLLTNIWNHLSTNSDQPPTPPCSPTTLSAGNPPGATMNGA